MSTLDSNLLLAKVAFDNVLRDSKYASSNVVISRLEKLSENQSKILPLVFCAKVLSLRPDYGDRSSNKWKGKPDGWSNESRSSFWESLTGDAKHKVTKCMSKMQGKVDNPGAFCASLRDRVEGKGWRSHERKARDEEAAHDIEPTKRSEWPEIPEGNKAAGGCGCGCGGSCSGCTCDRMVRDEVRRFAHANPQIAGMLLETLVA